LPTPPPTPLPTSKPTPLPTPQPTPGACALEEAALFCNYVYNSSTDGHGSFSGNPSPEVNYLLDVRDGAPIEAPVTVDLAVCSESDFALAISLQDGCPSQNASTEIFNATNFNSNKR
jgi:hypothetical protein